MENSRIIKTILFASTALLLATPFFVFSYDDKTTHPALAQETIALFNLYYPKLAFTEDEKQAVISGDIGEDESARWMHHFYDPMFNRGLWGFSSSKVWALDTKAQAALDPAYTQTAGVFYVANQKLFDSNTDYSWDRAIYDYVWADQERGLAALGHILHLIQDASVPDHTRNDAHPPVLDLGSPYEHWTKRFTPQTLSGLGISLYQQSIKPPQFRILQQYFHSLALYSNNNFFSKDTIFDKSYRQPQVAYEQKEFLKNGRSITFDYAANGNDHYKLVAVSKGSDWQELVNSDQSIYFLTDDDHLILTDYWERLSKQAVVHGVGVMRLFFEEAEKERINKSRWARNQSLSDKLFSSLSGIFGNPKPPEPLADPLPKDALALVPSENSQVLGALAEQSTLPTSSTLGDPLQGSVTPSVGGSLPQIGLTPSVGVVADSLQNDPPARPVDVRSRTSNIFALSPGFGGGGDALLNDEQHQMLLKNEEEHENNGNGGDGESFEDNGGSGDQEGDSQEEPDEANAENNDDNEGTNWDEEPNNGDDVPEGDNGETGETNNGNDENEDAPDSSDASDGESIALSFEILSCGDSFIAGNCAVATTSAALVWSSDISDASTTALYRLTCMFNGAPCDGFDIEGTQATSTIFYAAVDGHYQFTAQVFGNDEHASALIERDIFLIPHPIVINEVAWGGTAASTNDEWIELYNRTPFSIDLARWAIRTKGNTIPDIPLAGIVNPESYFLLERTDDNTISDISADMMYGNDGTFWALNNAKADALVLSFASSTVDEVAICNFDRWCGGSGSPSFYTMERVDFKTSGGNRTNWKSALGEFILNGHDANGMPIKGTPRSRNSMHYLISTNSAVMNDIVLDANYSPYLIDRNGLTIRQGATLRVPAGVVIKLVTHNEPSLVVEGTLITEGTEEEPVAITSFFDDEYGGDMNSDGICGMDEDARCPFAGSWKQVWFRETSTNSRLEHTAVRYGGRWFTNMSLRAMVAIDRSDVVIQHSVFEYATKRAIQLVGSQSVIEDSEFRFNVADADATGILVGGGSRISNNTFSGNNVGIDIQSGFAEIFGNKFLDNLKEAMKVTTLRPIIRDNEGSGNGTNGIVMRGMAFPDDGALSIFPNSLPYVIDSGVYTTLSVAAGGDLTIEPGVVFRNKYDAIIEVAGTLRIDGQSAEDILLTSFTDSASSTWRGIEVKNTGVLAGNGFTLRYAGQGCRRGSPCAGILVNSGHVELQNALIEKNKDAGVRLTGSVGSYFTNVSFVGHQEPLAKATGLVLVNSDIGADTLHFADNAIGVSVTNSTVAVADPSSITYSGNLIDAIPSPWF